MPPSACSTSQSTMTWRSPSSHHVAHGPQRPADEALDLVGAARRACPWPPRGGCARWTTPGSIEYSAVTQPLPVPRIHRGTSSSIDGGAQHHGVPEAHQHRPAGASVKSRSKVMGRSSSGWPAVVAHGGAPGAGRAATREYCTAADRPRPDPAGGGPRHGFGVGQLRPEQAPAELAEPRHVARGQEAVARRAPAPRRATAGTSAAEGWPSNTARTANAVSSADDTSTTSRPITSADGAGQVGVVGAPEQQRVDPRVDRRGPAAARPARAPGRCRSRPARRTRRSPGRPRR